MQKGANFIESSTLTSQCMLTAAASAYFESSVFGLCFLNSKSKINCCVAQRHPDLNPGSNAWWWWTKHLLISNIFKQFVCQCFMSHGSLPRVKIHHSTDRTSKVIINPLQKRNQSARLFFVKTIPSYLKTRAQGLSPRCFRNSFRLSLSAKYEIYPLDYNGQGGHTLIQILFPDGKDESFVQRKNA